MLLGVNIDHVATLRQSRLTSYPDPVAAALIAEKAGADSITLHLREDRRHIQESDIVRLKKMTRIPINLEMAATEEMIAFSEEIRPQYCCIVPEKRRELTTEGGLDIVNQAAQISTCCHRLTAAGIRVSLFIDALPLQLKAAAETRAPCIELHTGHFADAKDERDQSTQLEKIKKAVVFARQLGFNVHAGHGLNYDNVVPIASIPGITELNIGHAIIARAIFNGIGSAIKEIRQLIDYGTTHAEQDKR